MSRYNDCIEILLAYGRVKKELHKVGRLLRTTEAGKYIWAVRHKTATTGLKSIIEALMADVPLYEEERPE